MKSFLLIVCFLSVVTVNIVLGCECGLEGITGRIFKGKTAGTNKYPWMVSIRSFPDDSGDFYGCAGALIDKNHIITAAHCVANENGGGLEPSRVKVYLGQQTSFTILTSEPEVITSVWVHPEFDTESLEHDFAILTLEKEQDFWSEVSPICLPNSENGLSKLTVAGYGLTDRYQSTSNFLQEAEVDFIPKDECNEIYKKYTIARRKLSPEAVATHNFKKTPESQICAINRVTKADACTGDDGSPLMHKGGNGRTFLMGVVSGAWAECGSNENAASLYSRIAIYKDLISQEAPEACWQDLA